MTSAWSYKWPSAQLGIPRQLLFAKGSSEFAFKKFLKTSILEKQVQVFFVYFTAASAV